jgi:hypothetical protein
MKEEIEKAARGVAGSPDCHSCEESCNDESSVHNICHWEITDKDVADYPVYKTSCGFEQIGNNEGICHKCGKKIQITKKTIDN